MMEIKTFPDESFMAIQRRGRSSLFVFSVASMNRTSGNSRPRRISLTWPNAIPQNIFWDGCTLPVTLASAAKVTAFCADSPVKPEGPCTGAIPWEKEE